MSTVLKTFGLITGCLSVSYLTLTAIMKDPDKPYRGHLSMKRYSKPTNDIYTSTETSDTAPFKAASAEAASMASSAPQCPSGADNGAEITDFQDTAVYPRVRVGCKGDWFKARNICDCDKCMKKGKLKQNTI